jgi:phage gpG-like protein
VRVPPHDDRAWKRIYRNATALGGLVVKVGVIGDAADAPAEDDGDDEITVGRIAGVHEFGAAIQTRFGVILIPERSFIRSTMADERPALSSLIGRLAGRVIDGKLTEAGALGQLGARIAAQMQRRIARGIPPPNAPSTIARKGSSKPLIDTGRLRSSITWAVVDESEVG